MDAPVHATAEPDPSESQDDYLRRLRESVPPVVYLPVTGRESDGSSRS